MIVVDTTVLVYAVGDEHHLRDPCRRLIEAVGAGELQARTTVEAVQEFTHVRARRRSRRGAVELARRYATLFAPLLTADADDLAAGLELFREHDQLGAFDAVLAAAAVRAEARALVSADRTFAVLDGREDGIEVLDPAAEGFLDAVRPAGT